MASLLLVTQDPQAADEIQSLAQEQELRVRSVAKPGSAREWLAMQSFDALFIDAQFEGSEALDVLVLAWRHNPMLAGGIFDFEKTPKQEWAARALGAHVFAGRDGLKEMRECLRSLPTRLSLGESTYNTVLVVEDLDSPRDIICAYVESLGYPTVHGAGSADEALDLLLKGPDKYFCVLSDYHMPEKSGLDLLTTIRSNDTLRHLPVFILTSVSTSENLLSCIKAGATGFLAKPPKKKILREELEKAKRLVLSRQSPRLCLPQNAHLLEEAILRRGLR